MRSLSLVSKLTISVTLLFLFWWLVNEYQTYRYTVRFETKDFIADHYISNKLGIDIVHDFVIQSQHELNHTRHILAKFPSIINRYRPLLESTHYYFTGHSKQFTKTVSSEKNAVLSDRILSVIKPEYAALLIEKSNGDIQLLSRKALPSNVLSIIAQNVTSPINPDVEYAWKSTFNTDKQNYAFVMSSMSSDQSRSEIRRLGLLVNLNHLMSKLLVQSKDQHQLLLTSNQQFLYPQPLSLSPKNKTELEALLRTSNNDKHILETGNLVIVREAVAVLNWQLISIIHKSTIYEDSLNKLLNKLPSSLLLLGLISAALLLIFRYLLRNPINNIVRIISDPQKPNLDKKLPQIKDDELGRISSAYNNLLNQLQKSHSELERQVANRTKDLLEASQAAEAANQRKTEHLTSISHEIRTPLNGILGALELLQTTSINQKQKGLIVTAVDCCHSLLSLINNLLDFSRIEAGEIVLRATNYRPIAVIDEAMVSIESQVINKGVGLSAIVDVGIPEEMQLDPLRVRQILVNLLGNAIKFTERGEIKIVLTMKKQMLEYQIYDTGSGMTEKETITIFQPYVQGQHQKFGSGLGLPISKKLAAMMDGNLTVTSTKNSGSCFILSIPIIDASEPIDLAQHQVLAPESLHQQLQIWGAIPELGEHSTVLGSPELQYMPNKLLQCVRETINNEPHFPQSIMPVLLPWKLKVLVVDDIGINRDIISKMLHELGQAVYTAGSAVTALELGMRNIFDLVLMDIRMPEVNGYEATRIWRNSDEVLDNSCPIIALTANAEPKEQASIEKAGMDYYLTKPVTLRELNQALEIAADIQLEREVSLTINNDNDTPLIDIMESDLNKKLYSQLLEMLLGLKGALEVYNWQVATHILHTVKGSCGLAGLQNIANTAAGLETKLMEEGMLKVSDLIELNDQIQALEFDPI